MQENLSTFGEMQSLIADVIARMSRHGEMLKVGWEIMNALRGLERCGCESERTQETMTC